MWMYDKTGNYTVKSGYSAIQTWKIQDNHNPSTSTNNHKLWSLYTIPRRKICFGAF